MTRIHQDQGERLERERHAGIVIRNKKLLIMHRIKNGREYYVIPGGHRRRRESEEQAVIREVWEETGVKIENPKLALVFEDHSYDLIHKYYLGEWKSGEKPYLLGEEKDANSEENYYDPMWVDLGKIEKLNILPRYIKDWLMEYLNRESLM